MNYFLRFALRFCFANHANEKLYDDVDFDKEEKKVFWIKLIFILVNMLIGKIDIFGSQKAHNLHQLQVTIWCG